MSKTQTQNCYIRVWTHVVNPSTGAVWRFPEPKWDVLGSDEDVAFLVWSDYGMKTIKYGYQGNGQYLYLAKDLALDTKMCLSYYNKLERLISQERNCYDWDAMRPFYTPFMSRIQAYLDSVKPFIDAAVKERHDAWTRRRHLMALYTDPSRY